MNKIFTWLNGKKTTIGAIALLVVTSSYATKLIPDADLLELLQQISQLLVIGGVGHKAIKKIKNK